MEIAIAYEGKPLSQMVAEAIAEADGPLYNNRLDLHLTEAHKTTVIDCFTKNPPTEVAGIKVKEVGRKDGIKLYLEEGSWILHASFWHRTTGARLSRNQHSRKTHPNRPRVRE